MNRLLVCVAWVVVVLVFVGVVVVTCFATPFLVCDKPASSEQVLKYTGKVDGVAFETPYTVHPSGTVAIVYDMAPLNLTVVHSFSDIKACNALGCSDPAVSFQSPPKPGSPANIRFIN